jgi:hypothetical protein
MFASVVASFRRVARPPVRIDPIDYLDYFGRECAGNIRWLDGRPYYVKPSRAAVEGRLERLGYLLARNLFNVPEVFPAEATDAGSQGGPRYVNRIRLCQDHDPRRLPVKELTRAIASEIVFSAWVNRRDAHNSNRWYLGGVPMFFDFNAAFGLRPAESAHGFFRDGPNAGYVPNWRLVEVPDALLETRALRSLERGRPLALQPIDCIGRFWTAAAEFAEVVSAYRDGRVERATVDAGLDGRNAEQVVKLLATNKQQLEDRLRKIRTMMKPVKLDGDERITVSRAVGAHAAPVRHATLS